MVVSLLTGWSETSCPWGPQQWLYRILPAPSQTLFSCRVRCLRYRCIKPFAKNEVELIHSLCPLREASRGLFNDRVYATKRNIKSSTTETKSFCLTFCFEFLCLGFLGQLCFFLRWECVILFLLFPLYEPSLAGDSRIPILFHTEKRNTHLPLLPSSSSPLPLAFPSLRKIQLEALPETECQGRHCSKNQSNRNRDSCNGHY